MAAPITHIVLATKIFDKFFKDKIRKDFFVGSCFPDIRYLGVIDRKSTHFPDLTVADIKNEDSFLAGIKFHSILDIAREKFIVDNDTYSLCPNSKYITLSLKILEDEIFYQYVTGWPVFIDYLNEILPNEKQFNIAEKDLQKWHSLLQRYFRKKPDDETIKDLTLGLGFDEKEANEMNNNVAIMRDNKKIINILKKLYKNFDFYL